jgi:hypothetical protein
MTKRAKESRKQKRGQQSNLIHNCPDPIYILSELTMDAPHKLQTISKIHALAARINNATLMNNYEEIAHKRRKQIADMHARLITAQKQAANAKKG